MTLGEALPLPAAQAKRDEAGLRRCGRMRQRHASARLASCSRVPLIALLGLGLDRPRWPAALGEPIGGGQTKPAANMLMALPAGPVAGTLVAAQARVTRWLLVAAALSVLLPRGRRKSEPCAIGCLRE